jgi:hypothetical protein
MMLKFIEDRRQHERDLLAEYRRALVLPAEERPSADEVWLRYRASVVHGLANSSISRQTVIAQWSF